MKDVALKREDERQIVFANSPIAAFFFTLAFAVAGYAIFVAVPDRTRWFLLVLVVVAVIISIAATLRRQRLVLDLAQRRYVRETGYWPRAQSVTGSLDDIEHVALATKLRSRTMRPGVGSARQRAWTISLKFRGDEEPLELFEQRRERKAYARFESLARKLRVPALDRTGVRDKATPWERIGKPLAERLDDRGDSSADAIPPPPGGSRIELYDVPGRRRIVLPSHGFAVWVPVLFALPLAMIALGAAIVWRSLSGSSVAAVVLGALFVVAGLVLAFLFAASLFGNEWIAEERDELVFGNDLFGLTWRTQRTARRDVEEIDIKAARFAAAAGAGASPAGVPAPPEHQEVVLRSKTRLRRFGVHLDPAEREWLRSALTAMVQ